MSCLSFPTLVDDPSPLIEMVSLTPAPPAQEIAMTFVSLGTVVLDELRFPGGSIRRDVAGGSALYSTLGARLTTLGAGYACKIGFHVGVGSDFPNRLLNLFRTWDTIMVINIDASRPSTRALLEYHDTSFNERELTYTTPLLKSAPADLRGSSLLRSAAFHMVALPDELEWDVAQLIELRTVRGVLWGAFIVWDPAPASCTASNQASHLSVAKLVDVYFPNHNELMATFSEAFRLPSTFSRPVIEEYTQQVLASGVGNNLDSVVVIRCGEHGSLVISRSYHASWFPAYHEIGSDKVVDTTGAGSAFLGAFTQTYAWALCFTTAAIAGSVAASFVVEQVGTPTLTPRRMNETSESWNGERLIDRVRKYQERLNTLLTENV